jgi:hypothetical protein
MSNLGQYIPDVRLYVGDEESTLYSDSLILRALENSISYLGKRWFDKYLVYSSGIIYTDYGATVAVNTPQGVCTITKPNEGDVIRNCYITFASNPPPIIEQTDLPAILLASAYLLARSKASSSTAGVSWSTPDLSYSNIESAKTYKELMKQNLEAIEFFFKQHLGKPQVGKNAYRFEWNNNPIEAANWYFRMSQNTLR